MSVSPAAPSVDPVLVRAELARRELSRRLCESHPAFLLERVRAVDATSGEVFTFCLLDGKDRVEASELGWPVPSATGWFWQRELLDEWLGSGKHVCLKARQLGVTWLASGLALWLLLYQPGSKVLAVSIKESEAVKLVQRVWEMLQSLPDYLWNGAKVLKPSRGARPTTEIQLLFPDGKISSIEGLTSSPSAGHGVTAALVILDEFSRQEYASDTWKAVLPTTQGGGRVLVISTGNGVSDGKGGGNFFHHVWVNASGMGIKPRFLRWDVHPGRDEVWYREHALALPEADRGEQYPADPEEAFILSGRPFFDRLSLAWYRAEGVREPVERFDFEPLGRGKARRKVWDQGFLRLFERPVEGRKYAVAADVATGRGQDFSAAYVVDLSSQALVCEFHGKLEADLFAEQLHYLGRWFNDALIAVESAGGFGEPVIVGLRDGRGDRPKYPKLYRHQQSSRPDFSESRSYGFPMNQKTRPLVINALEKAVRDRSLPWVSDGLLMEMSTFVHRDSTPSPAAMNGTNDDRVMAAAIGLELYRLFGSHPEADIRLRSRSKKSRARRPLYSWSTIHCD